MCGIAGIILKRSESLAVTELISKMSSLLKHRGPDGEGFITINNSSVTPWLGASAIRSSPRQLAYLPRTRIPEQLEGVKAAFAHRRLAIIDLSESGHQPMCNTDESLWITYNGEVYNFTELRAELSVLGHTFQSGSDTEVVLAAYKEWGSHCVKRFNGMWAFCIYDKNKNVFFASRDRFGVKPFYYVNNSSFFAFASEQKAITGSGLIAPSIHQKALHNYLVNGLLENTPENFFEGILELWPGHNLVYECASGEVKLIPYFNLNEEVNTVNDALPENELIERISFLIENAIKLRLRSDVEVGTCLSGGIDSSVLVTGMASITGKQVSCFTSVFAGNQINEENFADLAAIKSGARHFKVEPTFEGFLKEANDLIYSQDVPIWSTSTYAQHKVMQLARINGVKVVLDGQGADELFGGYHHHFVARWNNLFKSGKLFTLVADIGSSSKSIQHPFLFYLRQKIKSRFSTNGHFSNALFNKDFANAYKGVSLAPSFDNLNDLLIDDIYNTRLKIFLKCEDRCGMWHGVESRTPFSDDVELIKMMFSFNANKKIQKGISKYLLREATKNKLPEAIYKRYDKKGFETPMEDWMLKMKPQLMAEINAADFSFVNREALNNQNDFKQNGNLLFKLFVLARWKQIFKS